LKKLTIMMGLTLCLVCAGCGDDDATGPQTNQPVDFTFQYTGMTPHVGQLVEFRIVSSADALAARAILDPLPGAAGTLVMPKGVPAGTFRLDFFADLNMNQMYDAPPADHAWRVDIPSTGIVSFAHNFTFTDISSPIINQDTTFQFNATGFTPHVNQLLELRVIEMASGRTVGQYRLGSVPQADFSLTLLGIIENGKMYQIDFYADLNGNGSYDAPPVDHAWRVTQAATVSGITVNFPHNTNFTDIGY